MQDTEIGRLMEALQKEEDFRERCFRELYRQNGAGAAALLKERGVRQIPGQTCRQIIEAVERASSGNIYTWNGRYRFLKPEKYKKSLLSIDGQKGEVSVNGHALEVTGEDADTYRLTSQNNVYHLTFCFGGEDEAPVKFTGQIVSKEGEEEETEGEQKEWYEAPEAQEFGMVMTILGAFNLVLGLILLAKDYIAGCREAPEREKDRQDLRETRAKIEEIEQKAERAAAKHAEAAGRRELMEKAERLAGLLDERVVSGIKEEMEASAGRHKELRGEAYREAVSRDVEQKIRNEYQSLLAQELGRYAQEVKKRYFDELGLNYDARIEISVVEEISENTCQALQKKEWAGNYCLECEIARELENLQRTCRRERDTLKVLEGQHAPEGSPEAEEMKKRFRRQRSKVEDLEGKRRKKMEEQKIIREKLNRAEQEFRKRRR